MIHGNNERKDRNLPSSTNTLLALVFLQKSESPELNPIKKNMRPEIFFYKNLKILNQPFFSESLRNFHTKYLVQLAKETTENFP